MATYMSYMDSLVSTMWPAPLYIDCARLQWFNNTLQLHKLSWPLGKIRPKVHLGIYFVVRAPKVSFYYLKRYMFYELPPSPQFRVHSLKVTQNGQFTCVWCVLFVYCILAWDIKYISHDFVNYIILDVYNWPHIIVNLYIGSYTVLEQYTSILVLCVI